MKEQIPTQGFATDAELIDSLRNSVKEFAAERDYFERLNEYKNKQIKLLISYLEAQRDLEIDDFNHPVAQAFEIAANKLKAVINGADDNTGRIADHERDSGSE